MLHSGSRNVGNTTASFYDRVAGERPLAEIHHVTIKKGKTIYQLNSKIEGNSKTIKRYDSSSALFSIP